MKIDEYRRSARGGTNDGGEIMIIQRGILLILTCIVLGALIPEPAHGQVAQEVGFSGSPNLVGSGARALGMGGAFIAVADDATAASWNPGGLIQLETPEISFRAYPGPFW